MSREDREWLRKNVSHQAWESGRVERLLSRLERAEKVIEKMKEIAEWQPDPQYLGKGEFEPYIAIATFAKRTARTALHDYEEEGKDQT